MNCADAGAKNLSPRLAALEKRINELEDKAAALTAKAEEHLRRMDYAWRRSSLRRRLRCFFHDSELVGAANNVLFASVAVYFAANNVLSASVEVYSAANNMLFASVAVYFVTSNMLFVPVAVYFAADNVLFASVAVYFVTKIYFCRR